MGTGYTRQAAADIISGNEIQAGPLNAEFNQLRDTFDASAGHSHSGGVGNGPKLDLATSIVTTLSGVLAGDGTALFARTLTAPAAGFTITNPAGVAGNPTFVLANDLAGLEGLATTGLAVRTGVSTWTTRALTAPAAGITVTNGDGVAGAPTLALANDLAGLEGMSGTGIAVHTAVDTWLERTLTGTASQITVTNGSGVAGNPTLSFPADVLIPTILTVPNAGLHVLDTDASHDLIITPGSNLTADRILTITTGDVARTLDISGANVTITAAAATVLDDASTAAMLTTLGAQPVDSDLTTIAGLTATTDNFIVSVASAWASRTPAQVRTTLALVIGTNVQAWDTDLDTWAAITRAAGFDTFATTPSSANLKALLTDETGTGAAVFAGSPALTGIPTFAGSTSGTTGLKASATAGATTLTLPAATDTLVGKATTDTLTNKTFDTAGTGNSFLIAGAAVTSDTGTGAVVRAAAPALSGAATFSTLESGTYGTASNGGQFGGFVKLSSTTGGTTRVLQEFSNANGIVGGISVTGTTTAFNTTSDMRVKENLRDFDSGVILDGINTYQFDFIRGKDTGYGVMAQELDKVFPRAVTKGSEEDDIYEDGFTPWSVDYSTLVPVLLHEVKLLRARVSELENK